MRTFYQYSLEHFNTLVSQKTMAYNTFTIPLDAKNWGPSVNGGESETSAHYVMLNVSFNAISTSAQSSIFHVN